MFPIESEITSKSFPVFFSPSSVYRYYFSVILVVYKLQQAIVTPFSLPLFNRFAPISSYFPPAFQYFLFTSSVPNLSNRFVSLTQKLFLPPLPLSSPLNFILSFSTFLLFAARISRQRKELSVAIWQTSGLERHFYATPHRLTPPNSVSPIPPH